MMSGLGQNLGMLGKVPGMKQMAMAKNMKKMMAGGGMPGFPGMPGMGIPGMGLPGMGFPGMGMPGMGMPGMGGDEPSLTKMKTRSQSERNAKKAQRKRERDARKKSRK
jgi:signal recognition particle subunit SRP54